MPEKHRKKSINRLEAYMVIPTEVLELYEDTDEYVKRMEVPYAESVVMQAEADGIAIGEVKRKDFGICSREVVSELSRRLGNPKEDKESRVILFYAYALQEAVA